MNANEVICNRALELLEHKKGEYQHLHPLDHVNLSQSTNDVYPTAVKLALQFGIKRLLVEMVALRKAFASKAVEFDDVLKVGRTQLQDAVPMTLGQEFSTYAVMLGEDEQRLAEAAELIREINLGATAIGTGINAHPDYAPLVTTRLSEVSGVQLMSSPNPIEATQDAGSFVQLSGVPKRVAVKLSKTCNDLRLLSSGPRAGIVANRERARRFVDESTALVTALTPILGYARSTEIAREALATGARVKDLVLAKKLMTPQELDEVMKPEILTKPHALTLHKPKSD